MEGWDMYKKIQGLKELGLNVSQIARKLLLSRNTVYKYLDMTLDGYADAVMESKTRKKILDGYEDQILRWLREYRDLSAAQVLDWLSEHHPGISVCEKTVSSLVNKLRKECNIPKLVNVRDYIAIEDPPPGQQCQIDFGTIKLKDISGLLKTLHFIVFVLSYSRYKYIEWLDRPFTASDMINAHEHAFSYFEGYPKELVYDQDHLIVVSENNGDIIYTREFQAYKNFRKFDTRICRAADPESKGRVENAVRFVKINFARHRTYYSLERLQEECLSWLLRTGNGKMHNTTKKIPAKIFLEEKEHLRPVQNEFLNNIVNSSITRTVRKDNTVLYEGNRYTVPIGTYSKGVRSVDVSINDDSINIINPKDKQLIASHRLPATKGNLIRNNHHGRNLEKTITPYIEDTIAALGASDNAKEFIGQIHRIKPRYIRDQLQLINETIDNGDAEVIQDALLCCVVNRMFGASDFKLVYQDLKDKKDKFKVTVKEEVDKVDIALINPAILKAKPQVRSLDVYANITKGGV